MAEPVRLDVDEVRLEVDGTWILAGVSLRVAPGELVGLIGPNGAGKTTFLRAISGLIGSTRGSVWLDGRAVARLAPGDIARLVAHVPQTTSIDFDFTCLEVVLMGRHVHLSRFAVEGPADYRVAEAAMEVTGTRPLADRTVTGVSGGERQRVLAARALAQEPKLLLLDEPTASLDVLHQLQLLDLVRDLVRQRGMSAIAAIHDLELAARYCDRLVLLDAGRVIASGTPEEVLTAERIEQVFGVRAIVRPDPITQALSITIVGGRAAAAPRSARVHVIAGGGFGSRVLYQLHAAGHQVSCGVLAENDTDYQTARMLGLRVVAVPPFCPVDAESERANQCLIEEADYVVVSPTPFGQGNLANLEAAMRARQLVLVDADAIAERDYTAGRATAIYRRLLPRAISASSPDLLARLHELMQSDGVVAGAER